MEGKRSQDSRIVIIQQMTQQDANLAGNVHGGVVMKHIDSTAGVVAIRHASGNVVTASIDRLDFFSPVFIGDLLHLKASLNMVGRTSMEVGVRVEAENFLTGESRHTASAYLTFVALGNDGRPVEVPPLILETEEERRRHDEAVARREMRLAEKVRERKAQR
ncbi:MAG: acyl-CoA thioesterase [Desulfobacterota bacterium]|jgi:acyl-CoA hydrolase|nr:acyl-CoA thioesterase [Thermodesulfobacteriota bacterium]